MKPIKFDRKLSLKKQTISHFNNQEMANIKGGWPPSFPDTCNTICPSAVGCCFTGLFKTCAVTVCSDQ